MGKELGKVKDSRVWTGEGYRIQLKSFEETHHDSYESGGWVSGYRKVPTWELKVTLRKPGKLHWELDGSDYGYDPELFQLSQHAVEHKSAYAFFDRLAELTPDSPALADILRTVSMYIRRDYPNL